MTGAGNWTYLLGETRPVLIDAGVGHAAHLAALADARPAGPREVLVTHAHPDHASGARTLAGRWPGTRLAKMPWPERDHLYGGPWRPLQDGEQIDVDGDRLEVVHTPGHAPDHVAFWHPDSRTLFSGDLLVLGSTVVIPASAGGDLLDYLASLRRVLALAPHRVLPAHGPPIDDPPKIVQQYLEHREQREAQVLMGLDAGSRTIDAMVAGIYRGLQPALLPMAKESVLAHLIKLERESRVVRTGDGWRLAQGR